MDKMRYSTRKNRISMWFNTKLFYVNGKPLKFHLEGYNTMEFHKLVKIIGAYGGKLSEPTGDTIIFSEPDRSIGVRQCYHLKYLRNCIMVNQLLELEKYKLPLAAHDHREVKNCDYVTPKTKNSGENHDIPNNLFGKIEQECRNKVNDAAPTIPRESCSSDDTCTAARTKPFVFTNERKRECVEQVKKEADNKKFRKRDNDNGSVVHDKNSDGLENISNKNRRETSNEHSSLDETVVYKKKPLEFFTEEENRQMIQYLIDKNAIHRGKSLRIWEEMKSDLKITHRTADSIRGHLRTYLKDKYKEYTGDVNARKEFEQQFSRKEPQNAYSEEEDRHKVQYIANNNSIPRRRVQKEMIDEKITDRTLMSPDKHFCRKLRSMDKRYTDDNAHEECEELNDRAEPNPECRPKFSCQRRRCPIKDKRWTEEENRFIIDYLIKNNVIHRANSEAIWYKVCEKAGAENKRTANDFYCHFKNCLRYKYGNYTSNSGALKKFAAIEKKKK